MKYLKDMSASIASFQQIFLKSVVLLPFLVEVKKKKNNAIFLSFVIYLFILIVAALLFSR